MNYFCLYLDMAETFDDLTDEEAGKAIKALLAYCNGREVQPLSGGSKIVYGLLRRQFERDSESYETKRIKLSENGKKGGRPKANESKENQLLFSESKKSQEEEKEEEEYKDKEKEKENIYSSERNKVPSSPEFCKLILNDGKHHVITEADVDHFKQLYPAVNIESELRKMVGWLESNPTKRKTSRGVSRFVNSWLARQQDKGGSGSVPKGKIVTETLYDQRPNNEPDSEDVPQWLKDRMLHKLA